MVAIAKEIEQDTACATGDLQSARCVSFKAPLYLLLQDVHIKFAEDTIRPHESGYRAAKFYRASGGTGDTGGLLMAET